MRLPIAPQDCHVTGRRFKQPFEDFDCCGLSCTVGTEQPKTLAGFYGEIQPTNRLDLAVVGLAQIATFDGRRHRTILPEQESSRPQMAESGIKNCQNTGCLWKSVPFCR